MFELFLCSYVLQIMVLRKQLDEMQAGKQELVVKYEEQLQHVKDEVRSAFILAMVVVVHIIVTHTVFF